MSESYCPELQPDTIVDGVVLIKSLSDFDQAIAESYYCDKILKVGGIMAFHDYGLLYVKSACNFVETNLNYRLPPSHSDNLGVIQKVGIDDRKRYYFIPFIIIL